MPTNVIGSPFVLIISLPPAQSWFTCDQVYSTGFDTELAVSRLLGGGDKPAGTRPHCHSVIDFLCLAGTRAETASMIRSANPLFAAKPSGRTGGRGKYHACGIRKVLREIVIANRIMFYDY